MLMSFKKGQKYYHLHEQINLFGSISLICSWGSINSNRGGHKIFFCRNALELQQRIKGICKIRKYRGYREC